jgi:hypothetical protein
MDNTVFRQVGETGGHGCMWGSGSSGKKFGGLALGGEGKYLTHHLARDLVVPGVQGLPLDRHGGRWLRVVVVAKGRVVAVPKRAEKSRSK